jgi:hypothetical protein
MFPLCVGGILIVIKSSITQSLFPWKSGELVWNCAAQCLRVHQFHHLDSPRLFRNEIKTLYCFLLHCLHNI